MGAVVGSGGVGVVDGRRCRGGRRFRRPQAAPPDISRMASLNATGDVRVGQPLGHADVGIDLQRALELLGAGVALLEPRRPAPRPGSGASAPSACGGSGPRSRRSPARSSGTCAPLPAPGSRRRRPPSCSGLAPGPGPRDPAHAHPADAASRIRPATRNPRARPTARGERPTGNPFILAEVLRTFSESMPGPARGSMFGAVGESAKQASWPGGAYTSTKMRNAGWLSLSLPRSLGVVALAVSALGMWAHWNRGPTDTHHTDSGGGFRHRGGRGQHLRPAGRLPGRHRTGRPGRHALDRGTGQRPQPPGPAAPDPLRQPVEDAQQAAAALRAQPGGGIGRLGRPGDAAARGSGGRGRSAQADRPSVDCAAEAGDRRTPASPTTPATSTSGTCGRSACPAPGSWARARA